MALNRSDWMHALLDRGKFTRTEAKAVAIASAAFALIFSYPLVAHFFTPGVFNDWDFFLAPQWAAYFTIDWYHQLPLWNPFECGGIPMLGDPDSHFLTPWFLLTMLFRPQVGLHLEILIHSALAWSGGYVLARVLQMRRISAICTGTAFAGSSWFFLRASEGHFHMIALVYLPWIIAAALIGSERGQLRYAVACGALIALSFFEGGPYPALYEGLTLGLVMVGRAAAQLSVRPLIALALAGVFAAGFGAVKYAPAIEVLAAHPRPTDEGWSNSIPALRQALLSRQQDHSQPSLNGWGFFESGSYVGLFAFIAIAALLFPRRSLPWIFAAIILFQTARGWTSPNCLWVLLHRMPMFSSTRLPSRLLIPFTLMVAVLAGIGIDVLCIRGSATALAISALLIVVGGIDMLLVGPPNLHYVMYGVADPGPPRHDFAQYDRAPALVQTAVVQHNEGVINCYVYRDWPTNVKGWNDTGYLGEQYLKGPGTARLLSWTPNVLRYQVDAPSPTVLVINQNYDPSWRVLSGAAGPAVASDGLLSVPVSAGKNQVVLRYVNLAALYGFAITLVTTLIAIVIVRIERRPDPEQVSNEIREVPTSGQLS